MYVPLMTSAGDNGSSGTGSRVGSVMGNRVVISVSGIANEYDIEVAVGGMEAEVEAATNNIDSASFYSSTTTVEVVIRRWCSTGRGCAVMASQLAGCEV